MNNSNKKYDLRLRNQRGYDDDNAEFSLANSQNLKLCLKAIWEELFRQSRQQDKILYFPYHLIRQQSEQQAIACRHSYAGIPLERKHLRHIQSVEVEILALDTAFKCSAFNKPDALQKEIQQTLIALRIIFSEFKENTNQDCQKRLTLFADHITRLIMELKKIVLKIK